LGVAYKKVGKEVELNGAREGLVFVGFVGMIDPPRKEAKKSIKTAFKAGIRPVMITGDNEVTAVAVAREVGILRHGNSISGPELEKLSDKEVEEIVEDTEVFARISPKHKLRIVDALMKKDHIVAMTGDGINDAPALKKADIGIAMGIKGTDVSREAADMILTDDNFASIVAAIEEGRSIFQNIRKYLVYLLSGNFGTVLALTIALVTVLPIPLTAVQILFINFLMDGLIAIALGVEPPEKGLMDKKPRKVSEGILNKRMLRFIFGIGTLIGLISIGFFTWAYYQGYSEEKLITLFFVTLIFSRLFNALNCRSFDLPALALKFYSNTFLLISYIVAIIFTVIVVEVELFHSAFHTTNLNGGEWLAAILVSACVWIIVEVGKIIFSPTMKSVK
jgi:Ca2+-transporting ATPase